MDDRAVLTLISALVRPSATKSNRPCGVTSGLLSLSWRTLPTGSHPPLRLSAMKSGHLMESHLHHRCHGGPPSLAGGPPWLADPPPPTGWLADSRPWLAHPRHHPHPPARDEWQGRWAFMRTCFSSPEEEGFEKTSETLRKMIEEENKKSAQRSRRRSGRASSSSDSDSPADSHVRRRKDSRRDSVGQSGSPKRR